MIILVTLYTTRPTWTKLRLNLGLHGKKVVANYLFNGMAHSLVLHISCKFLFHLWINQVVPLLFLSQYFQLPQ